MAAAVATFDNDSGGREVATGFGFCKTFARSGELAASGAYAVPEHEPAMARCSVACAPLATREDPTACETLAATLDVRLEISPPEEDEGDAEGDWGAWWVTMACSTRPARHCEDLTATPLISCNPCWPPATA